MELGGVETTSSITQISPMHLEELNHNIDSTYVVDESTPKFKDKFESFIKIGGGDDDDDDNVASTSISKIDIFDEIRKKAKTLPPASEMDYVRKYDCSQRHLMQIFATADKTQEELDIKDIYLTQAEFLIGISKATGFEFQNFRHLLAAFPHMKLLEDKDGISFDKFTQIVKRINLETLFALENYALHGGGNGDNQNEILKESKWKIISNHVNQKKNYKYDANINLHKIVNDAIITDKIQTTILKHFIYNQNYMMGENPVRDEAAYFAKKSNFNKQKANDIEYFSLLGTNMYSILRLGIRHNLHPLGVDNIIRAENTLPKVTSYGEHNLLISLPIITLTKEARTKFLSFSMKKSERYDVDPHNNNKIPLKVDLKIARMAIFTNQKNSKIITFQSIYKLLSIAGKLDDFNLHFNRIASESHLDIFEPITDSLQDPFSELRQGHMGWLIHRIVELCINELLPVTDAYRFRLEGFELLLDDEKANFSQENITNIIDIKRDLLWILKKLKMLCPVITSVKDGLELGREVGYYWRHLEDQMQRMMEDLLSYVEECDKLKEEAQAAKDNRMNETLYLLTLVTTVFIPAQFLTGLYGMNFVEMDTGDPNIPELKWKHGYTYFWTMVTVWTASLLWFFKVYKKWL